MSIIPLKITPARQPGCQRHARGTLWQYQERQRRGGLTTASLRSRAMVRRMANSGEYTSLPMLL